MSPPEPGQVLGGKYRLARPLGEGGMGSVWHAEHLSLRSPVALKLIDPVVAKNPEAVQRFLREARTAAALRSPHVVQILDYGVEGETPYIAMEMLEGESLAERLTRLGRLSIAQTTLMLRHVARAVGRAHEAGIVHRDLKPDNIFIVSNDDEEVFKVLDFGIVKGSMMVFDHQFAATATRTGTLIGTPSFMSPEQAEGVKSLDFRADLWALGVITFRCMLGRLPFTGETVGRLILEICSHPLPVPSELGDVPAGFDVWFARACARDPMARFASAKEAAEAFERLDLAAPVPATPPPTSLVAPAAMISALDDSSPGAILAPASALPRHRAWRQTLGIIAIAALGGALWWGGWHSRGSATTSLDPPVTAALTALPVAQQPAPVQVVAKLQALPEPSPSTSPAAATAERDEAPRIADAPAAMPPSAPLVSTKPVESSQRRKAANDRRKAARNAARDKERLGIDLGI